jgi:N,N'-diacetyllegionaminate synthase
VGFSDHTQDDLSAVLAVGLGATVIEKHFTMDRGLPGPDHAFAAIPSELQGYVSSIRRAERALGSARIRVANAEAEVVQYRTGLVLRRPVRAGEVLREDAVVMKRPGWGIPPQNLKTVLGHRVLRDLEEDHILTWNDFLA